MRANSIAKLTEEQYLEIERASDFRSEFFDGEMYAMSGASLRHSTLHRNLTGELYLALRGSTCEAFGSDLRVRVSERMYVYPDLTVVCGKPLLAGDDNLLNPVVIVEILSPATEKYDRGLKLQHYRTIESLKEYILVDQGQVRIEQYTRQTGRIWTFRDYGTMKEQFRLDSISVSIALNRIYDRVDVSKEAVVETAVE